MPERLEEAATADRLWALADAGCLSEAALHRALELSLASPDAPAWRRFLSNALLFLGSALILAGGVYFFAYNWERLGRFQKFALLESAIVAAVVAAWRLGSRPTGKAALAAAAVLIGPLLGVYGQVYQTGADPYELFLGWAALMLPWVAAGVFSPLWLVWLAVLETSVALYWEQVRAPPTLEGHLSLFLLLSAASGAAWLAVEWLSRGRVGWLSSRWLPRALAAVCFAQLLVPAVALIVAPKDAGHAGTGGLLLALAVSGAVLGYFQRIRHELFMLAVAATSLLLLLGTFIGHELFPHGFLHLPDAARLLAMGLVVVSEASFLVWWLRRAGKAAQR